MPLSAMFFRSSGIADGRYLSLDGEADFHGYLEFLHLIFRDAATLLDNLEPFHATNGMCRLGDRSSYGFGKTDGGYLSLDGEADFHGYLEFLHLIFRDAATLLDNLEPFHA